MFVIKGIRVRGLPPVNTNGSQIVQQAKEDATGGG
jgi:hypothetical protein